MNLYTEVYQYLKFTIMKKVIFFIASLLLATTYTNAKTVYSGYNNSFIFVENGIEFSVFKDGQFDFNILRNNANLNVGIHTRNVNISFNSGYDYNSFVQYDEYGAIIQIENIPIFYDYYGRITRAGNVAIHYNNFGLINRVGGLYVHYNRYNRFSHYTGYINRYNRSYVHRPWHRYYSVPARDYCVVYNRPYRRYYTPVRYDYRRPYYNNRRPVTAIASRRGTVIHRNKNYATVNRGRSYRSNANKTYSRRVVTPQRSKSYKSTTRRPIANSNVTKTRRTHSAPVVRRSASTNNNRSQNRVSSQNTRKQVVSRRTTQTPRGAVVNRTTRKTTVKRAPSTTRTYSRNTTSRATQNKNYSRSRAIASTSGRRR